MAGPLREPESPEGGGFAAAHLPGAPRRLRGRPSGPKGAAHRAARDSPAGCLDPGDLCGPWRRKSGQAQARPAVRAARKPGGGRTRNH